MPWSSKGYRRGRDHMAAKTAAALWRWSDGASLPIVDRRELVCTGPDRGPSPQVVADSEREQFAQIEVLDSIEWVHDRLLPRLQMGRKVGSVAVHPDVLGHSYGPGCKAQGDRSRAGAGSRWCRLARRAAAWPAIAGLLHPELPASALRDRPAAEPSAGALEVRRAPVQQPNLRDRPATGHRRVVCVVCPLAERLTRP